MGLSFHYKGALKNPQSLKKMIEEVTDIALANKWSHHVFEEAFPKDTFTVEPNYDTVYGICFSPPNCEVVCLTFLSTGKLSPFWNLEHLKVSMNESDDSLSVKTQFSGPKIHMQLITIFDYLHKKYFENFELTDEGNYWETKNEQLLEETFNKYTNLIDGFSSLLENIPIGENESMQDYLIRIAEMVHKKNNGNDNSNKK
jgi:hypothetical protein